MTQFVDGAPLDASILAALESKIDTLSGKVISVGDSSTSGSRPELAAGTFKAGKFTSGAKQQSVVIPFNKGTFSKPPTVVATIVSPQGGLTNDNVNIAVGDVTTDSVTIWVYFVTTEKTKEQTININWIALAY